jgi:FkbM family methyltransferase
MRAPDRAAALAGGGPLRPLKAWLDFALAQAPGLYRRILYRRRVVNLEKLAFLAVLRRGDVVFDVGANTGHYTLLFSHLVGRRGRVHAFEPVPPTFAALAAHLARARRFDNVELVEGALAASERTLEIFLPGTDHGQAAIVRHAAGAWSRAPEVTSYSCQATTLDSYLRTRGQEPPAFVKCDVEGAELRVLEGAVETLRHHPPLLHLEVNPDWTRSLGYQPADLVGFLSAFGYTRFVLLDERERGGPLSPADAQRHFATFHGSANLVCGVPEVHAARLGQLVLALEAARRAAGRRRRAAS